MATDDCAGLSEYASTVIKAIGDGELAFHSARRWLQSGCRPKIFNHRS